MCTAHSNIVIELQVLPVSNNIIHTEGTQAPSSYQSDSVQLIHSGLELSVYTYILNAKHFFFIVRTNVL